MSDQDALRERLQTLFLEELDEHVGRLEQGLERLAETLPHVEAGVVGELFRSAHSLKGAAQSIGVSTVGTLCHQLEDSLARVRDGSLTLDEQLLDRLGVLTDAVAEAGRGVRDGAAHSTRDVAPVVPAHPPTPSAASVQVRPPSPGQAEEPAPERGGADRPGGGTVRVAAETFDALLGQAADLVTSGYRSESLVAWLSVVSARLVEEEEALREDLRLLRRALEATGKDHADASRALDRIDRRSRQASEDVGRLARAAARHQRELGVLTRGFAAAARRARTVPFTDATAGLGRVARSAASPADKDVRLVVDAADVRIDRRLVATLHDILGHLVRNAVDHGLEAPQERERAGKPRTGLVRISAALRSDGVEVVVVDDGRGVREHEVRTAARRLGQRADDERTLAAALFRPGLSTSQEVSAASGRGVGLDAVRTAVEDAGGTVILTSEEGHGVRVTVILPLTLSTVRAVLVRVAGETVALPSSVVQKFVRLPHDRPRLEGREVASVDGEALPVVRLADVLGWADAQRRGQSNDQPALMLAGPEGRVLVVVDALVQEREIVLQTMPPRLSGAQLLLGTAQLEDGSVVLALSPSACVRTGLSQRHGPGTDAAEELPQRRVLLVEDTLTTRELERSILEAAGYSVIVTADGSQAWQVLQNRPVDAVVSDVNMPNMDGIALCRAIRGATHLTGLPVVLVTSLHSEQDRRAGLEAGADAYLTKAGFDREDLLQALERLL